MQWRSFGNIQRERSCRTMKRRAVGGAHHTVIGKFASVSNVATASNLPRLSTAKIQAPMFHGPNKLDHAALAQPRSETFHTTSPGLQSSQISPVIRCPSAQ